jgi:glutathione S-transferase
MITLLQLRKCPWAAAVRQTLANVEVDYGVVQVPYDRSLRDEVIVLTGQDRTPVLIDGDTVLWDSRRIVAYIYETYGDARQHERADEIRARSRTRRRATRPPRV